MIDSYSQQELFFYYLSNRSPFYLRFRDLEYSIFFDCDGSFAIEDNKRKLFVRTSEASDLRKLPNYKSFFDFLNSLYRIYEETPVSAAALTWLWPRWFEVEESTVDIPDDSYLEVGEYDR